MIIPSKQTIGRIETSAFTIIESLFMLLALLVISFIIAGLLLRKPSAAETIGAEPMPSLSETPGNNGQGPLPAP